MRSCKIRKQERSPCKYLTSTELFNGCDSKLYYDKYFKACTLDMCDCPGGKCYCDSLMAYARECQRLGVAVHKWQRQSYCLMPKVRRKQAPK